MPLYPFVDSEGRYDEFFFLMKFAPSIGTMIERDGKSWLRVVGNPTPSAGIASKVHGFPYVSLSNCRWSEGAKHTKSGKPIITSQRHEREFCARHSRARD